MLTLQNDPPSLESVSEDKEQYKAYGKSIRKMISDCLQKDPSKRPSATELLKYSFFKKSKDRKYLMQTLLTGAPSIEERVKKARRDKRPPGASGRLHRTNAGDWVWSDDEEASPENSHSGDSGGKASDGSGGGGSSGGGQNTWRDEGTIVRDSCVPGSSSGSSSDHHHNQQVSGGCGQGFGDGLAARVSSSNCNLNSPTSVSSSGSKPQSQNSSRKGSMDGPVPLPPPPEFEDPSSTSSSAPPTARSGEHDASDPRSLEDKPINLVLRMRNSRRELNDIRFEFNLQKGEDSDFVLYQRLTSRIVDTADGIAQELEQAGLVEGKDVAIIATHLHQLVSQFSSPSPAAAGVTSGVSSSFSSSVQQPSSSTAGDIVSRTDHQPLPPASCAAPQVPAASTSSSSSSPKPLIFALVCISLSFSVLYQESHGAD